MKKLLVIAICWLGLLPAMAQENQLPPPPPPPGKENKMNVEALKVAFITRQLNLSVEEAQKFWPVHNAYTNELKNARKDNMNDELLFEEKVLGIRKKYSIDFKKILNNEERVNKIFKSEKQFGHMVGREIMGRKGIEGRRTDGFTPTDRMEMQKKILEQRRKKIGQKWDRAPQSPDNKEVPDKSNMPENDEIN
jgi:hypothetical protein